MAQKNSDEQNTTSYISSAHCLVHGIPRWEIELAVKRTWGLYPFSYHRSFKRVHG